MTGEQLKMEGLDRVEENNQRWVDKMRERAIEMCLVMGEVSSDELRYWADAANCHPEHQNAWGAVFRGTAWVFTGRWKKSTYKSNHAREIKIWRYQGDS